MLNEFNVGPALNADGVQSNGRSGRLGDQIVSELHGRYYEQSFRRNIFVAANQSVGTTTVGLSTTYQGCCVSNPIGSQINVAVLKVSFIISVATAAVAGYGVAVGFNGSTNVTHTTPIIPVSTFYGTGASPVAKADYAATLPTAPVYVAWMGNTPAATTSPSGGMIDFEGALIIPPGAYVLTASTAASPAGFFGSIFWEEVGI